MRLLFQIIILSYFMVSHGQVAQYNQFPSMRPLHILDDKLSDISFAFGMRILESDYNGPLIRLRRDSDNAERDFYCRDDDKVDINAIDDWRGTANVYVVRWYDQSGLGRNAVQSNTNLQPRFVTHTTVPYFQGNGSGHRLDVNTSIQTLTNAGADGTVLGIITATRRSQNSFGVLTGTNRWSAHVNWSNGHTYFDPGPCCNNPRNFNNAAGENQWRQYTFIRGNNTVSVRQNGSTRFSGNHTRGRCTLNNNFGILYANGRNGSYSNNRFNELIMFRTDISSTVYTEIEENQTNFWNL
ncbi:MAG: hypothetical protein AB3N16_02470 [Flavobacteriaceae bacterium]